MTGRGHDLVLMMFADDGMRDADVVEWRNRGRLHVGEQERRRSMFARADVTEIDNGNRVR